MRKSALGQEVKGRAAIMQSDSTVPDEADSLGKLEHPIDVRPAAGRKELLETYRLVYESYRRRDYLPAHPSKIRMTLFNTLPEAVTFLGIYDDTVIATVSLIPDSPGGLPMDEVYRDEVQALRDSGRRIAEVTMLADRRIEIRRTLPLLLALMKMLFDCGRQVLNATDLCITINPRHDEFYKRYLLFDDLGPLRSYPSVRDNPAVARRLNLDTVRGKCGSHALLMRVFFEDPTPAVLFEKRYRMTADDVAYFAEQLPFVPDAPGKLVSHVREYYPHLPWERWLTATRSDPNN